MKQRTPLISVVMTAYNAALFVSEAVHSILSQTYSNFELIIVNDGSTDKTGSILRRLAKQDKRIRLITYSVNRGASYASNLGIARARGQYIARMDADDISLPDRLEKQLKFLESNLGVIAVGGQCQLINKAGDSIGMKYFPVNDRAIYDALFQFNPIQHPSLMVNTSLLGKRTMKYHHDVLLAHDLEILFYLAQFGKLANLSDVILRYRIHSDSLSLKDPKLTFAHTLAVRNRAVRSFGYRPTPKGYVVHSLQRMLMEILPNQLVYPLFRVMRMSRSGELTMALRQKLAYTSLL